MAEHYLDTLTVSLRAHDGHPLPSNLTDAMSLTVAIGTTLDLDQLVGEIRADMGGRPRRIQQTYVERAWGAAGASAILLIDVPTVFAGLGGVAVLWDVISKRVRDHGRTGAVRPDTDPAEASRKYLAENLNIGTDSIRIVEMESVGDSRIVHAETPLGTFTVELSDDCVTRFHRT